MTLQNKTIFTFLISQFLKNFLHDCFIEIFKIIFLKCTVEFWFQNKNKFINSLKKVDIHKIIILTFHTSIPMFLYLLNLVT